MQKDGSIIIQGSDFLKGANESPLLGAQSVVNCDILSEKGVLKIASDVEKRSNTVNNFNTGTDEGVGVVVARMVDNSSTNPNVWLTERGYLGTDDAMLASNLSKGWDVVQWNSTYVLVSYSSGGFGQIGVIEKSGSLSYWATARVTSLTSVYAIKMIMGQDGYVYFTNGNTIGRITAISGTGAGITVTSSSNVLNLPRDIYATTLIELGSNLLIGTQKGTSWPDRNTYQFANIYPWDRTSSSFRLPIQVNEAGINAMIHKDNQIYFSAGVRGNVYVTDGVNYQKIKTIPFTKINKPGATCTVYYNAIAVSREGNLLIGTSTLSDTQPNLYSKHGVWEIGLSQGYPTVLAYTTLSGEVGMNYAVDIGDIYVGSDVSFGSRINTTTRNCSILYTTNSYRDNYYSYYESELFFVGTRQNRKTYQSVEFTLLEPMVDNQTIKLSYRQDGQSSYTTIGEWSYDDLGGVVSHYAPAYIADAEFVQIKIEMKQAESVPYPSNLKLLRVILK